MKHYQEFEHREEPQGMLSDFFAGVAVAALKWLVYGGAVMLLIWLVCEKL